MMRLPNLAAVSCLAAMSCLAAAALMAAEAQAQQQNTKRPYVQTPAYVGPPVPVQPQRTYPTPRDPLVTQPEANANQINPYFRTDQLPTNSPLYRPYQQGATGDPFAPPSSFQGSGAKSYNQNRAENPPAARPCANFDRMSDAYANCKAAQTKEVYSNNQQLRARQQPR